MIQILKPKLLKIYRYKILKNLELIKILKKIMNLLIKLIKGILIRKMKFNLMKNKIKNNNQVQKVKRMQLFKYLRNI